MTMTMSSAAHTELVRLAAIGKRAEQEQQIAGLAIQVVAANLALATIRAMVEYLPDNWVTGATLRIIAEHRRVIEPTPELRYVDGEPS